MRWFRFAVLVIAASILQTSLVDLLAVRDPEVKPDLLLILLVFFALRAEPTDAVIASFSIGFVADLISPAVGLMGPRIISFGVIGTLLSRLNAFFCIRRMPFEGAAIFAAGLATGLLTILLSYLRAAPAGLNPWIRLLWQPVYSAVLGPFLFLPVAWGMRITAKKRRRSGGRLKQR
jgi:rod shape-determining protein MreD